MQSTRLLAANMLRQPRTASMLRMQATRRLNIQASPRMRMPVPGEEQSGHTISQRLRKLKRIPPELVPLGVVLAAALIAAGYAMIHKLYTDKTLRLSRQGPAQK